MHFGRIVGGLMVLLILAVIAGGIAYRSIDWNDARPYLHRVVKDTTGRELHIKGELTVRLWPKPVLSIGEISLSNADWGTRQVMFEAGSLNLRIAALPLLVGDVRLESVMLSDARLFLEETEDGQDNWIFVDPDSGLITDLEVIESVSEILLEDLHVEWKKPIGGHVDITVDRARIVRQRSETELDLDARFHKEDKAIHLTGSLNSSLAGLLRGEGLDGKVTSYSPGLELELEGGFGRFPSFYGLNLNARASGSRWPILGAITGLPTGATQPWQLTMTAVKEARKIELHDIDLVAGKNDLSGSLLIDIRTGHPRIEGHLLSSNMDLTAPRVMDVATPAGSKNEGRTGKIFSDIPLELAWISTLDALIDLNIETLKIMDVQITDMKGAVEIVGGALRVEPLKATMAGVTAFGSLLVDVTTATPAISTSFTARQADIHKITDYWNRPPFISARGDIQLVLSGTGESIAAVLASSTGRLSVITGEGTARVAQAEDATATLVLGAIARTLGKEDSDMVKMNCFMADIEIEQGVGEVQVMLLDTENTTILSNGTIDLAKEQWNLEFKPKPHTTTLTAKAVPVMLKGSFSDPEIEVGKAGLIRKLSTIVGAVVFPPAAVAALLELGTGDDTCLNHLKTE